MGAIIYLAILALMLVSMWKIFVKLGIDGWKSIIPIYNLIVLMEALKWDLWKIILFLIPIVNIVFGFLLLKDLAAKFGKGIGFAIGLFFLSFIFLPILAFSDAQPVQS